MKKEGVERQKAMEDDRVGEREEVRARVREEERVEGEACRAGAKVTEEA